MKSLALAIQLVLILALCGCASSGVVQLSPDTYIISKTSAAGAFANMSRIKGNVIKAANEFAAAKGKIAIPISFDERRPIIGGLPSIEYQFRLVDKNSPEATPTAMMPRSDSFVEKVSTPIK